MSTGWDELSLRAFVERGQLLQWSTEKLPNDALAANGSYALLVVAQSSEGEESNGAELPLILRNCSQLISRLVII